MHFLVKTSFKYPKWVAIAGLVLLCCSIFGLTKISPSASVSSIVGKSAAYEDDRLIAKQFGDEAITLLIPTSATGLIGDAELGKLAMLEACVSGKAQGEEATMPGGAGGPCARLAKLGHAHETYGPATAVSQLLELARGIYKQIAQQQYQSLTTRASAAQKKVLAAGGSKKAAAAAAQKVRVEGIEKLQKLANKRGISNPLAGPSLNDLKLVRSIILDENGKRSKVRPQFETFFPGGKSTLVAVRLKHDLADDKVREAVNLIKQVVDLNELRFGGQKVVVSGAPTIVGEVANLIQKALFVLLAVGFALMAAVLTFTFGAAYRLLPLLLAGITLACVFGLFGLVGLPLNLGTIATLPVLLGLAVDYGVQLHASVTEKVKSNDYSVEDALLAASADAGPRVAIAGGATVIGFVALLISSTPLVRAFGAVLIVGVVLAILVAATLGSLLYLQMKRVAIGSLLPDLPTVNPANSSVLRKPISWSYNNHKLVLMVAVPLAIAGAILGLKESAETDIRRLIQEDLPVMQDLKETERTVGFSGELRLLVEGPVRTADGLQQMQTLRDNVLRVGGYDAAKRDCANAVICPMSWPGDLFVGRTGNSKKITDKSITATLENLPAYLIDSSYNSARNGAVMGFGLKFRDLKQQSELVEKVRAVAAESKLKVRIGGLPVLAADSSKKISSVKSRALQTSLALVLVGLFLLVTLRSWRVVAAILIPILIAVGLSSLAVTILGLQLNPLSVMLSIMVIAIATEFSVLLVLRYRQERRLGMQSAPAVVTTMSSTGAAVATSALTAVAGFLVLTASSIPMLRQFGFATVVDLIVAVLAVAIVLPAIARFDQE